MPDTEDLVSSISGIFQAAEDTIIQRIAYGLSSGTESPDTWAQQKALELRAMQSQVQKDIGKLDRASNDTIQSAIFSAWKDASGDDFLSKATISALPKNYRSVLSLAQDTTSRVSSMGNHILRTTDDVYRQAVQAAAGQVSLGLSTLDDAVYDTVDRMAKQGITGFVDKAGRNWGMDTYAEMAVRTATQRASIDAHVDKLRRMGQNLVKVSDAYGECSLCRPWEGKVLSIAGDDDPEAVATISQATDAGLFHPGCRHRVVVYIPGMPTTVPEARPEPKVAEAEARQRQIERTAREWDRREKAARAAGNDDGAAYAHNKLLAWRKEAKSHAESSGIARRTKAERAFTLKEREIEQETLKKAGKQFDEITAKIPGVKVSKPKVVKPEPVKPKVFKPAPVPPNYVISELRQIPKDVKHAQRELAAIDEYLTSAKGLGKDYRDVFTARKKALAEWIENGQDDAVLKRTEAFDRTRLKVFEEESAKLEAAMKLKKEAQKEAIKAAKTAPVRPPAKGSDYFTSADGHKLNPHWEDSDGRGKINCIMCTSAAEIRARGEKVVAAVNNVDLERITDAVGGVVMSATGQAANYVKNFEKLFKGDRIFKKTTSKTQLLRELDSYPDGSRSAVTVGWKQGSSHIFSVTKRDGRTWITDMQTGLVTDARSPKADLYWDNVKWTVGAGVMRIDDLELDMELVKYFKWTEKD